MNHRTGSVRFLIPVSTLAAGLILAGCGLPGPSAPTPPGLFPLRTVDVSGGVCATMTCACAGVGVGLDSTTIDGSPTDPRVAWLASPGYPDRSVVFPTGFVARFTPKLEVLNANGVVVYRAGDRIAGACVEDDGLLIGWP